MQCFTTPRPLAHLVFKFILLPLAVTSLSAVAQTPAAVDRVLLDMRQAYMAEQRQRLTSLLPRLQGHPLEGLGAYWEMRLRLPTATPDHVQAFLTRWQGTYYEDRLRNDWLLDRGKARDWHPFNQALPLFRMNDDREVQCYALVAQGRVVESVAAQALTDLWLAQRTADDGCALAAQRMLAAGTLSHDVVWQRARLGLERQQPAIARQALQLLNPAWGTSLDAIDKDAARYLRVTVGDTRHPPTELVTLALVRLATHDPVLAAEHMASRRWRAALSPAQHSWVWATIGRRAALRLDPNAHDYFAHANNDHLFNDHLVWKTRAALRAEHWPTVYHAIQAMTSSHRAQAVWTYWLGRAMQATEEPDALAMAHTLWESVAGTQGFYEQLALEALGRRVEVPPAPPPLSATELANAQQHPGLQRALRAMALGLRTEGGREWVYAVALHTPGGMSDRELLAAAHVACAQRMWDRCISTSLRTRYYIDHSQRFPMPFEDVVLTRSRDVGLDPATVYGLIHQESRFVTHARSHAGAAGLMQIMPATAQWTARQIGLRHFQPRHINDTRTNIVIGTAYLKLALDDFEGAKPLAIAAYNAGASRPRSWRNGPVLEAAIWIETIPFEETRQYVQRVLSNSTNYAARITGQPQRLSEHLSPIGPKITTAQTTRHE